MEQKDAINAALHFIDGDDAALDAFTEELGATFRKRQIDRAHNPRTPDNIELFHGPNVEVVYQGATEYGQHLLWTPVVTSNGQVGLHIRSKEGGQSEFLYFNPSIDERNVFVYHGGEFDPNDDPTECFISVAVDWDGPGPLVEHDGEGKRFLVVGIIDDFGNQDEPKTVREFFRANSAEEAYDMAIAQHNTIVIAGIFFNGELVREGWSEDRRVR